MLGLNSIGKIVKMEYDLTFELRYNKLTNKLTIIEITSKNFPREARGFNIGLNIAPGYTRLSTKEYLNENNTYGTWNQSGESSFQVGLESNYYIKNKNYGFGARINFSNYESNFSIDTLEQENIPLTDKDNDDYILISNGNTLKEKASTTWISIPVFFQYRYIMHNRKRLGHLYFNIGPDFAFAIKKSFKTSSNQFTYKGYYPEYHVELENIPEYGFIQKDNTETNPNADIKSFNISLMAEAGINIPLISNKFNLNLSVLFEKGLLNLSKQNDNYIFTTEPGNQNTLIDSRKKVTTFFFGFNIGILYKLF